MVLGGMLAAAVLLCAVGGVAGLLFGDGWAGGSLARHAGRRGAPARPSRRPAGCLAGPRASDASDRRRVLSRRDARGARVHRSASAAVTRLARRPRSAAAAGWAKTRDLGRLTVPHAVPRRIVLGRYRGQLLAAEEGQSALVVAPTQTRQDHGARRAGNSRVAGAGHRVERQERSPPRLHRAAREPGASRRVRSDGQHRAESDVELDAAAELSRLGRCPTGGQLADATRPRRTSDHSPTATSGTRRRPSCSPRSSMRPRPRA